MKQIVLQVLISRLFKKTRSGQIYNAVVVFCLENNAYLLATIGEIHRYLTIKDKYGIVEPDEWVRKEIKLVRKYQCLDINKLILPKEETENSRSHRFSREMCPIQPSVVEELLSLYFGFLNQGKKNEEGLQISKLTSFHLFQTLRKKDAEPDFYKDRRF